MNNSSSDPTADSVEPIFSLAWDQADYSLVLTVSVWLLVAGFVLAALLRARYAILIFQIMSYQLHFTYIFFQKPS